jgi:hypothetical protein
MFMPISARVVGSLVAEGALPQSPRVVELGAQTYSVDADSISSVQNELRSHGSTAPAAALERFKAIRPARTPREPHVPHMSEFFKALGFASYEAIDISDYGDTTIMDLNEDIQAVYHFEKQYDLVTNIGVSEHLINQYVFFKNAHAVTRSGGYMMHILPSVNFANHGFFNYQPRFFMDLAAANGYEIRELYLADRTRCVLDLLKPSPLGMFFYHLVSFLSQDRYGNLFVVAVLKKIKNEPFRTPLQGKYVPDITDTSDRTRYDVPETVINVPTKGYFAQIVPSIKIRMQDKLFSLAKVFVRFVLNH